MNRFLIKLWVIATALVATSSLLWEKPCYGMEVGANYSERSIESNESSASPETPPINGLLVSPSVTPEASRNSWPNQFTDWSLQKFNNHKKLLIGLWTGALAGSVAGASFMAYAVRHFREKVNESPTSFYFYIDIPAWIEGWWNLSLPYKIASGVGMAAAGIGAKVGISYFYNNYEICRKKKPTEKTPPSSLSDGDVHIIVKKERKELN